MILLHSNLSSAERFQMRVLHHSKIAWHQRYIFLQQYCTSTLNRFKCKIHIYIGSVSANSILVITELNNSLFWNNRKRWLNCDHKATDSGKISKHSALLFHLFFLQFDCYFYSLLCFSFSFLNHNNKKLEKKKNVEVNQK